tara:strand:+ start:328 stop:480 length:153 start_codon:yes stop_codon:yes gene_type:complete
MEEKQIKDKLIKYSQTWETKLRELADENITNVSIEIKVAIRNHLVKNNKL